MRILSVVGARPQFIKAAMVSPELRKSHREVLVHTGQHYDFQMSQVFFNELAIPEPDYNLGIGSGSHALQTARMMLALEEVLTNETPDMVVLYGDTNSTVAAALTAAKMHIPIAHVEAGPRMFDRAVPEEVNRVVTDHLSTLLFAPTRGSATNLAKEGINSGVHFTGDVMYDAFLQYAPVAREQSRILERYRLNEKGYIYTTVHRARNTDSPLRLTSIVDALLAMEFRIIMPVHPRTHSCLNTAGLWSKLTSARHITICEPTGYNDSLMLTMNAKKVVTDSGGLQREAYFASVPCVTIDSTTPWPETLYGGWNTIVNCDVAAIVGASHLQPLGEVRPNVFGDGLAAREIVRIAGSATD